MNGPHWIKQWIANLAVLNEQFRDDDGRVDFEALGREEYQFRMALITQNLSKSPRAKETYLQTKSSYDAWVENGKKGGRPKKSPQDAPNGNAGVDMSDAGNGAASKSPTSCDTFTADGDIREDSQDCKSRTSATHYVDAHHREAGDESATVSRNMRRVPQNEAPAHGFSGGRTAQGTMSPSPSGAAQDGKFRGSAKTQGESNTGSTVPAVCPESGDISKARQSQARESRRTGTAVPELRRAAHSPAPVRSSGPMPANVQKVYDFASLEGLDKDDAYECWYVTTAERDGNDADGNPVTNWKAFVRTWCNTRSKKRSA